MEYKNPYFFRQVELLVRILPLVGEPPCFALKGGTAINLFAGKMMAALDRQHPRDLFDIKGLFGNEGISVRLKEAFIVYLISHNRRMVERLRRHLGC